MRRFATTRHILLCAVAALFAFSLPAQKVSAAVIQVDEACSLHDAIVAANTDSPAGGCPAGAGADTIKFDEHRWYIRLSRGLPPITSDVTIIGNAAGIVADGQNRHFLVDGGTLTLKHVTLAGGKADSGGAIYVTGGGKLNIHNSRICHNVAEERGGGIYADSTSVLSINRSVICENDAHYGGGVALSLGADVTIRYSAFHDNYAEYDGGAIRNHKAKLRIEDSTISDNIARGHGGAIEANYGASLIISGSAIVNNQAGATGGGIHAFESSLDLYNSTISGNRAKGRNYEFSSTGGGIYSQNNGLSLTHVTVVDNYANWGGGLFVFHSKASEVKIVNSILAGNAGDDCRTAGDVTLSPSVNNLIEDGSCRAKVLGDPSLHSLTGMRPHHPLQPESPAINAADPGHCLPVDQLGRPRPKAGACDIGAIESAFTRLPAQSPEVCTLYDQIIASNRNTPYGACQPVDTITLTKDILLERPLPHFKSDVIIEGNGYSISGANAYRIFTVGPGAKLTLHRITLKDGNAWAGGAVFADSDSEVIVTDCVFSGNTAVAGGAIAILGKLRVAGSTFIENYATEKGGAIQGDGSDYELRISRSSFHNNAAKERGGAINIEYMHLSMYNTTISSNSARQGGGIAFRVFEHPSLHVYLEHVSIAENRAIFGEAVTGKAVYAIRNSIIGGSFGVESCDEIKLSISSSLIEDNPCQISTKGIEPLLDGLASVHGYHPLLQGSPAIDAADPRFCPPTDQLGNPRPLGDGCDLGAIEYMGASS